MIGCEGSKLGLNNLDNWISSPALLGHWQLHQNQTPSQLSGWQSACKVFLGDASSTAPFHLPKVG